MSSGNRQAPMPPPKPRNLGRGQFYHQGGYLTPQDSDTDSGISADCDQGSPRAAAFGTSSSVGQTNGVQNSRRIPDLPPTAYQNLRSQSSTDYLTPNSARKIAGYSTTPRRLPAHPQQQQQPAPPPTKAKYRVRFADEVDSGASTSSGTSSTHISPRNDPQEMLMNSAVTVPQITTTFQQPAVYTQSSMDSRQMGSSSNNDFAPMSRTPQSSSSSRTGTLQRTPNRRLPISSTPQPQPTYADQMQSVPEPPPYTIAMQRLRSVDQQPQESFRDAYIRKSVNDTLQRRYRQRSSSLPRGNKSYYDGMDMYDIQPPILPPQSSLMTSINQLPGSLDNLHITNQLHMGGMRRRKLPTAPLMGSSCQLHLENSDELTAYRALQFQMMQDELQRQPPPPQSFERQPTLLRRTNLALPPQSFNIPHITTTPPQMAMAHPHPHPLPVPGQYLPDGQGQGIQVPGDYGTQSVRAQLVALDQRGFRRVLVEKMMPGPFGFYIATGVVAGQRAGIFISRVSLPSLSPMLTVGDEIIYVDEEYVKGRSLEYVQSVIAGKTSVTITLLPAVGQPAMC